MDFWEQIGITYDTLEILRLKYHLDANAADLGHYLAIQVSSAATCETALREAFYATELFRRVRPWWRGDLDDAAFNRDATSIIEQTRALWDRTEDERR